MDACVLIDFLKSKRSVIKLISEHVGPVYVTSPVVEEIQREIKNENELIELGLCIIEPEIQDAFRAVNSPGPTSFQDHICFLVAEREELSLVTNDTHLRRLCKKKGIPCLWGLQPLVQLHCSGGISSKTAVEIARKIHQTNPRHITNQILERFIEKIRKQAREG